MYNRSIIKLTWLFAALCSSAAAENNTDGLLSMSLEQLLDIRVSVGSRGMERSLQESPVPVEIVTAAELASSGFIELGPALLHLLPYFNYQYMAIRDGSDHSLPFSMRGMSSDQVLVLVNGKRYHPGALTHLSTALGRGANSVDLNNFPLQAIEQIEILKDGAAAQYGSDAIAGIINIILKKNVDNSLSLNLGQTSVGDGEFWSFNFQHQFKQSENKYLQLTASVKNSNATIRSGADNRTQYFDGDSRNDDPANNGLVRMEGASPQRSDLHLTLNGLYRLTHSELNDINLYGFANFNSREGNSAGFNRRQRDNRTIRAYYPDGFLPRIEPEVNDVSLTIGANNNVTDDSQNIQNEKWSWDVSNTFGRNSFHYFVTNSANVSLGLDSPTEFDSGRLVFSQNTLNMDVSKASKQFFSMPSKLSFGLEYRQEKYQIIAGEEASYIHGGVAVLDGPNAGTTAAAGAQVFSGFQPQNEQDVKHKSQALYADLELYPSDRWLFQMASRFENHDDFGSNSDYKLATSFTINPRWKVKSSLSTGFRAPSLAQQYFTTTSVVFLDDELTSIGTFGVNEPVAKALGAQELKAEKSDHASLGFSYQPTNDLIFSLDLFQVEIQDRIELSGNIRQNVEQFGQQVVDILQSYNVSGARFFTNTIDTKTKGADLSAQYTYSFESGDNLHLKTGYHYNDTDIVGEINTPNILENNADVIFDRSQINRVTERSPHNNLISQLSYTSALWQTTFRAMRFGSVKLIFSTNDPTRDQRISGKWLADLDVRYKLNEKLALSFGGHNIFDTYPDFDTSFEGNPFFGEGNIFQYSDSSPFGFNGADYYIKLEYDF